MVLSAFVPGAEISTRDEPFSRCAWHFSFEVKMPVHSITTSTSDQPAGPRVARGAQTVISDPPPAPRRPWKATSAGRRPRTRWVVEGGGAGFGPAKVLISVDPHI